MAPMPDADPRFESSTFNRRGELVDASAAQAATNALTAGVVLVAGNWSLWS